MRLIKLKLLILFALTIFSLQTSNIQAQNRGTYHLSYSPSGDGGHFEFDFSWMMRRYAGLQMTISTNNKRITGFTHKGSYYSRSQIQSLASQYSLKSPFDQRPSIYNPDVSVGITYGGGRPIGRVTATNILNDMNPGEMMHFTDSKDVGVALGMSSKEYPEWEKQARAVSPRVERGSTEGYMFTSFFDKISSISATKDELAGADQAYNAGNLREAKSLYQNVRYDDGIDKANVERQIDRIDEQLKAEKDQERYDDLIAQGDELAEAGSLNQAKAKYEAAAELKPGNGRAEQKSSSIEDKIEEEAEEEAAAKKAAEAEEEDSEDSEESDEEGDSEDSEESDDEEDEESEDEDGESSGTGTSGAGTSAESQAIMEEFERQQRVNEYHQQKMQQMDQNFDLASEMGASMAMALLYFGTIMYSGIGNDEFMNIHKGNSYKFSANIGYAFTTAPMHTNSSREFYDGYDYTYTDEAINYQTGSIDIQGGFELWPLYGDQFGVGLFVSGSAGVGLFIQNSKISYEGGVRAYAGTGALKLYTEISMGNNALNHHQWLDPYEFGSGTANWNYTRIAIGPRFSFQGDFLGETQMHLDILPIFELQDHKSITYGNTPLILNWTSGLQVNLWAHNRMRIFGEALWNYKRTGELEYGYSSDATNAGILVRAGAIRSLDVFGDASYSFSYKINQNLLGQINTSTIGILRPTVTWFNINADSTSSFFNSEIQIGISPLLYEKDFTITQNLSITGGVTFTYNSGGIIQAKAGSEIAIQGTPYYSGTNVKLAYSTLEFPIGLRFSYNPKGIAKYFARTSLGNNFLMLEKLETGTSSSITYSEVPLADGYLNSYIPSLDFEAGIDFPVSNSSLMRVGLQFKSYLKSVIADESFILQPQAVSFSTGFVF